MVADRDRLRPLEMRVARHRCLGVRLRAIEERGRERCDRRPRLTGRVDDVEPNAAATWSFRERPTWIFLADVAEQTLDRGVDVLVLARSLHRR